MATADELLMATAEETAESTEEILVADLNTRVISIPTTLRILGVESDDDVKRLQFRIPRYYGEFDLSTFDIRINFENARGGGDVYPVDDTAVTDDDYITFTWLVDRVAYEYDGDVKFSICMKLFDNTGMVIKELNTTYATLPVLPGLETEKALIEQNPSAFDQVMYRLYAVEAATGNGQNGYYSVVKVAQADSGALFTIVNQDGESVAYVRHGTDGEDGYTPVKGVDYWTAEDTAEIAKDVGLLTQTYVNQWAPISCTVSLIASQWASNQQTVTVKGVTDDNLIVVSPSSEDPSYSEYTRCGIRCTFQTDDSLVFECRSIPTADVKVNVAVYYSRTSISGSSTSITASDDGEGNVSIYSFGVIV